MTIEQGMKAIELIHRIKKASLEKSEVQSNLEKYERTSQGSTSGLGDYKYPSRVHVLCYQIQLSYLNEEIERATQDLSNL